MATSYQQLWEQQKKKGVSQTRDGGTVSSNKSKTTSSAVTGALAGASTNKNSGAAAASASANKQASSGQYLTKDGGVVTGTKKTNAYTPASSATTSALAGAKKGTSSKTSSSKTSSAAATSANKQASSGVYQTRDGGTVTGSKKANAYTPAADITPATVAASAYEKKLASMRAAQKQTSDDDDDYQTTRDQWKNDAIQAHYDTAGIGQYRTRDNGLVTQPETGKQNPYMGATDESSRWTLSQIYSPTASTWQQDAGIIQALTKFRGNTDQLYYTNEQGQRVAFPMQNLNLGGGNYVAGTLQMWDHPDSEIVWDSHGNRMTLGNLKQGLANGYYAAGNEAAYNNWLNGVAVPASSGTGANYISESYSTSPGVSSDYDSYLQAILDAQQAQTDALNQSLLNQRSGVDSLYDQNAQDLYAQYRRSQLGMPEQLAGTATGTADSLMLQNDLNYQNNLETNELERIAALNDVDAQVAQNQADADLQAAQTAAEWAQMAYQQRQAELEAEREYQLALAKANSGSGNGSDKRPYTISELEIMLENGIIDEGTFAQLAGVAASSGSNALNNEYSRYANQLASGADVNWYLHRSKLK